MILLQSQDKFNDLAQLDTATGQIFWLSRCTHPEAVAQAVCGHIARIGEHILCLYRLGGVLHFRIDSADWELNEEIEISLQDIQEGKNRLTIARQGVPLVSLDYRRSVIRPPLAVDPTPFVEEEDFDFCLFVCNVVNDPDRKVRIYGQQLCS
jgi:hypothetical protein